jgi:hypothetical protein
VAPAVPRGATRRLDLKLSQAVIVGSIAAAALWIEQGHRTVTDAPTSTELEALAAARACPDSENMPYTAGCLAFLEGGASASASGMHWRPAVVESASADRPAAAKNVELSAVASQPACADNDTVPYTANCIAFMTGWFWRPNTPP